MDTKIVRRYRYLIELMRAGVLTEAEKVELQSICDTLLIQILTEHIDWLKKGG